MQQKYETLLKTLQKICELNEENRKLKRENDIYKDLFLKEVMSYEL